MENKEYKPFTWDDEPRTPEEVLAGMTDEEIEEEFKRLFGDIEQSQI